MVRKYSFGLFFGEASFQLLVLGAQAEEFIDVGVLRFGDLRDEGAAGLVAGGEGVVPAGFAVGDAVVGPVDAGEQGSLGAGEVLVSGLVEIDHFVDAVVFFAEPAAAEGGVGDAD